MLKNAGTKVSVWVCNIRETIDFCKFWQQFSLLWDILWNPKKFLEIRTFVRISLWSNILGSTEDVIQETCLKSEANSIASFLLWFSEYELEIFITNTDQVKLNNTLKSNSSFQIYVWLFFFFWNNSGLKVNFFTIMTDTKCKYVCCDFDDIYIGSASVIFSGVVDPIA